MVMRSNPALTSFLIFQLKNILRSYLKFSTSYGRSTDLKWLGEKNFTKIFTYWGDVCPSMSKRCRHRLCPDLLKDYLFFINGKTIRIFIIFFSEGHRIQPSWIAQLLSTLGHFRKKSPPNLQNIDTESKVLEQLHKRTGRITMMNKVQMSYHIIEVPAIFHFSQLNYFFPRLF